MKERFEGEVAVIDSSQLNAAAARRCSGAVMRGDARSCSNAQSGDERCSDFRAMGKAPTKVQFRILNKIVKI